MRSIINLSLVLIAMLIISSCGNGFKKLPGGVEYKILKSGTGKATVKVGDVLLVHIINATDKDSVIMDSHKGINGMEPKPFKIQLREAGGKMDVMGWLMHLKEGDSAVFVLPTDSIFADDKMRPPFIRAHSKVKSILSVVKVMTEAQAKEEDMAAAQKQAITEEATIQNYIKEKGLSNVQKTASGIYYVITKPGTGSNIVAGKKATMNYTGMLTNGKVFDSNINSTRHANEPFKFTLGKGEVIRGWDEGVALLNKGAKATLIIPSSLGYGSQAMGNDIPANSVLVFDVELLGWE